MIVGAAVVELHVHGSHSLKEKRGVVRSVTQRLRNRFNVSVAEIGGQDTWQRAVLGIASTGNDRVYVRGQLARALAFIEEMHLAEVIDSDVEVLELCYDERERDDEDEEPVAHRLEKVGEELRSEIARLLRAEVADPRVALVTILRVDVSPDLRNALVFWSRIERGRGPNVEAAAEGLASAASFLRRRLAHELPLKRMPALEFRYDAAIEDGDRTLALLKEIADESAR